MAFLSTGLNPEDPECGNKLRAWGLKFSRYHITPESDEFRLAILEINKAAAEFISRSREIYLKIDEIREKVLKLLDQALHLLLKNTTVVAVH